MSKIRLTDLSIQKLKPPQKGQKDYWDSALPSFGVRVSQGGSKTFVVVINRRRKSLGRYPNTRLKYARSEAQKLLFGRNEQIAREILDISYADAVERFLQIKEPDLRPRTFEAYARVLTIVHFDMMVRDIRPFQVEDALNRVTGQASRAQTFTVLKMLFGWCVSREYCDKNPMQNLKKPRMPPARERVLSDDELALIWKACEHLGTYGVIVQLLMLTGQRQAQIANLHTTWVQKDHVVFPGSIMKNKLEHYCPLLNVAQMTLMRALPIEGYYFSPISAVGRPFSAWSKSKRKLDEIIQIDPWRLHDLRRTWSTNAARLDVEPHIIARVLSHALPEGKISAIYNRHKYRQQMSDAMEKVNDHILSLLLPHPTGETGFVDREVNSWMRKPIRDRSMNELG